MIFKPEFFGTIAAIGSAIAATCAAYIAWYNARIQRELEKRRFITVLQNQMSVSEVDPNDVIPEELIDTLNALEFFAVCWEMDIVDKRMAYLVYGASYINTYKNISAIKTPVVCHGSMINGNSSTCLS